METIEAVTAHNPGIEDIVDLKVLQRIQDTFSKAMGVAAVTVNKIGTPITRSSNFQPICQMIRSTPTGLARCKECDARGGLAAHYSDKPEAYVCLGGLMDVAAPITIENEYIGCLLCGQVILTEDRDEFVKDIVTRNISLDLPRDQLLHAAHQIPAIPRERLDAAVEMLMLTANHIVEIGMANLTQARLLKEAQEKAAMQAALQHAQLRALQSQINPHFLFNSLTLVGYTALEENAPRTEEIAYTLSDLLRYSLRNTALMVPLSEEVEMIDRYLTIQQIRFGNRLNKHIELDPALQHLQVPCMLLQPLVENAIVHAVEPSLRSVTVKVRVVREDNHILLEVSDDGVGMDETQVTTLNSRLFITPAYRKRPALGLQSVVRRLEGEYNHNFDFRVESAPERGCRIMLFLALDNGRSLG
ncbi:MAG: histidine kinase [Anaerolineales bacterium]|nr:histidine kinase [Anaerolineales bacterium]